MEKPLKKKVVRQFDHFIFTTYHFSFICKVINIFIYKTIEAGESLECTRSNLHLQRTYVHRWYDFLDCSTSIIYLTLSLHIFGSFSGYSFSELIHPSFRIGTPFIIRSVSASFAHSFLHQA